MADTNAPQRQPQQPAESSTWDKFVKIAQQLFLAWAVSQLITRFLAPAPKTPATSIPAQDTVSTPVSSVLPPTQALPAWPLGQVLSMHVYLASPSGYEGLPRFVWENITLGDYKESRTFESEVKFPKSVLNNGTLWADIYLVKNGASANPQDHSYHPNSVHHVRKVLTPYMPKAVVRKEKNLLSAGDTEETETPEETQGAIVPHWHSNITLALISDATAIPITQLPPPVAAHVHLVPGALDETKTKALYKPIVFPNEFWHLRSQYVELNHTTPSLPLRIEFQPMSYMKFQIFASMTHGFNEAAKTQGAGSGAELDEIKRMLTETNPYFLALTGLVTVLHMVFEMLAFKSDVSHWRQKKEMVGVSVRTIITNVFVQLVILLYLIDNNTDTSWMILMGSGVGVLIEAWKITKAVDISLKPAGPGSRLPYRLDIQDKHVLSEDEKKTQEYDKLAFRYVSWVTIPLLAGYTVYSLLYETHRGWYSFIISTLTSFVYMFGFAQLIPQLIINYKLKSVAHMPMKAMIYKTLSTVVDDFFAFCIKMPFLHRLACFRDDLVFLIFLYQRWIYRIDPNRINEYGQVAEEGATDGKSAEAEEPKKLR